MNINPLLLSLSLAITAPASALKEIPIKDHGQTKVEISAKELNRIALKEDRVQQVFGIDDLSFIEADEATGQLFIKPKGLSKGKPLTLTLITEKGLTHDLRLFPQDIEAEATLLYDASVFKGNEKNPGEAHSFVDLISLMRKDATSPEFTRNPLPHVDREFTEGIEAVPLFEYLGTTHKGLVYILRNKSEKTLYLKEKHLALNDDVVLSLEANEIIPGGTVKIYILKKLNGRG